MPSDATMKFVKLTIKAGGAIHVNPAHVVNFQADPHGGTLVQFDADDVIVREEVGDVLRAMQGGTDV